MDDDVGYFILRVTRDQPWQRYNVGNLPYNLVLALAFEWAIGLQTVDLEKYFDDGPEGDVARERTREFTTKAGRQIVKDYVAFPALTSLSPAATYKSTLKANALANLIRSFWAHAVIVCGHFPDGAEKFTNTDMQGETKGEWYLRQMLGSANFDAGPVLRFLSGNLCHQIEHHLFTDLPSNRLHEVSVRVRAVCEKYDLPYTTASFAMQYGKTWRTVAKLSLPNKYLRDTADDAPETRSERMFTELEPGFGQTDPATGRRRGLKTAIAAVRQWRRGFRRPHLHHSLYCLSIIRMLNWGIAACHAQTTTPGIWPPAWGYGDHGGGRSRDRDQGGQPRNRGSVRRTSGPCRRRGVLHPLGRRRNRRRGRRPRRVQLEVGTHARCDGCPDSIL